MKIYANFNKGEKTPLLKFLLWLHYFFPCMIATGGNFVEWVLKIIFSKHVTVSSSAF